MNETIKKNIKELENTISDISNLKKKLKILNDKKIKEDEKLIKLFEQNNLMDTVITTNNYKIEYTTRQTTQSISRDFLRDSLSTFFEKKNISLDLTELLDFIYNSREITKKNVIKTQVIKKNKN